MSSRTIYPGQRRIDQRIGEVSRAQGLFKGSVDMLKTSLAWGVSSAPGVTVASTTVLDTWVSTGIALPFYCRSGTVSVTVAGQLFARACAAALSYGIYLATIDGQIPAGSSPIKDPVPGIGILFDRFNQTSLVAATASRGATNIADLSVGQYVLVPMLCATRSAAVPSVLAEAMDISVSVKGM